MWDEEAHVGCFDAGGGESYETMRMVKLAMVIDLVLNPTVQVATVLSLKSEVSMPATYPGNNCSSSSSKSHARESFCCHQ